MSTAAAMRKSLAPFIKTNATFFDPRTHMPIQPNVLFDGQVQAAMRDPSSTMMLYDPSPDALGRYGVCFGDGHVRMVPKKEWLRLKAEKDID